MRLGWWGREEELLTPDLGIRPLDGLAGLDVENLELKVQRDTSLVLGHVLADVLAGDVVGSLGDLGAEDTRAVAGEDDVLGGRDGVVRIRKMAAVQGAEIANFWLGVSVITGAHSMARCSSQFLLTHRG